MMLSLLPLCQLDAVAENLQDLVEIWGKKTFLKSNFDQQFELRCFGYQLVEIDLEKMQKIWRGFWKIN